MLRSRIGIERMINLITILYSAMKLLPYLETDFSEYQTESVQDFRWYLSKRIREQLIIQSFVKTLETQIKSSSIRQLFIEYMLVIYDRQAQEYIIQSMGKILCGECCNLNYSH